MLCKAGVLPLNKTSILIRACCSRWPFLAFLAGQQTNSTPEKTSIPHGRSIANDLNLVLVVLGFLDLGYFCWEHREQSEPHGAIRTRASRGPIPLVEVPALGLVLDVVVVLFVVVDLVVVLFVVVDLVVVVDMDNLVVDMVEQTVLRNQQGVRLERTLCS